MKLKCDKSEGLLKERAGGSFSSSKFGWHEEATIWPTKEDKKAMISNARQLWGWV